MGTKIKTLAESAGVKCPKVYNKMHQDRTCRECEFYAKCSSIILGVLLK